MKLISQTTFYIRYLMIVIGLSAWAPLFAFYLKGMPDYVQHTPGKNSKKLLISKHVFMNRESLTLWANRSVCGALTVSHENYLTRYFGDIKLPYFSDQAWEMFQEFQINDNIENILEYGGGVSRTCSPTSWPGFTEKKMVKGQQLVFFQVKVLTTLRTRSEERSRRQVIFGLIGINSDLSKEPYEFIQFSIK